MKITVSNRFYIKTRGKHVSNIYHNAGKFKEDLIHTACLLEFF
jgi:hypothetical protein